MGSQSFDSEKIDLGPFCPESYYSRKGGLVRMNGESWFKEKGFVSDAQFLVNAKTMARTVYYFYL